MAEQFGLRTAGKIAWRELRATPGKFLFVVLAVAVGVGALTGVRGFSQATKAMLMRDARKLLAADASVRISVIPTPHQTAAMDALVRQGAQRTWITETVSMATAPKVPAPQLLFVKAVEPGSYPFYGEVKLASGRALRDVLTAETVVASSELPPRMKANPGDTLRLGGQEFRIADIVLAEPDRLASGPNVGMHVLVSREGLARTGLLKFGSRAGERFLFRVPPTLDMAAVKGRLTKAFPEGVVSDYRETDPAVTRGIDNATSFLSLVSLIALIVGALGVAMAMYSHLQQRMDSIAIMKSLGGRSAQIMRIYLLQTLWLGVGGGLLGLLLGFGVQRAFPVLLERLLSVRPDMSWDPLSLGQGLLIGVLTTLLFTVPPLLSIRSVRPGLILRRDVAEEKPRRSLSAMVVIVLLVLGFEGIGVWLSSSWKVGSYFIGGLLVSLSALAGVAWLLLRGLRLFLGRTTLPLPATVRHGIANVYRPGNQAPAVLVALGIGVMFTLTTYLVQNSILKDILSKAPPGMANVFLIDVSAEQRAGLERLLQSQPGVQGRVELVPSVAARLVGMNGRTIEQAVGKDKARRFQRLVPVSWAEQPPENTRVLRGSWWRDPKAMGDVSLSEGIAKYLGAQPGTMLEFTVLGKPLPARVAAVHRAEGGRLRGRAEFLFSPATLARFPAIYNGGMRVDPQQVPNLQRVAYEQFPTVTVINMADTLALIQQVVDQIALIIRFLSSFAILAGVVILASSVAGTRFRRVREVVILKTLGATRSRVAGIFSVEFLIIGLVAGLMGALLASVFTRVLMLKIVDGEFHYDWRAAALAVPLTALIANAAGWLASFRILGQKPLEILREQ